MEEERKGGWRVNREWKTKIWERWKRGKRRERKIKTGRKKKERRELKGRRSCREEGNI